jgi:tape measure domain-containing protein
MAEVHSIHIQVDSTQANKATTDLNKMAGATSNAEKALGNLIGIAKGLVALETLRRTASYAIEAADSFTLMSSKLKLATSSQGEYNKAQTELFKIAQSNSTALGDTVQLYSRLATGMKEMGKSQAETLKMTDAVAKSLRISGASASETSSVITQFSQAIGSGVLRGEEFNAIMENGNRLARALADGLGVPIGKLRELAQDGKLTGDVVVKAIMSQTAALDAESKMMQTTVSQSWVQLQNAITQYIGEADQANGTTKELSDAIVLLAKNFKELADPIANAISTLARIEIGGWLALSDAIKSASVALKEMVGIQQAGTTDPEVLKLMKMGQGQASIDEIAGKQAQATEKAVAKSAAATAVHLDKTSKGAKKAADEAQRAFEATMQANVSAAENASRLQEAVAETSKKRLENELDAAKEKARLDSKEANSYEEKLRIAEELQKKSEEIIAKEAELRLQALDAESQILAIKIAGVEQEIAAADRYNLTQAERIKLQTELATLQTQQQIIPEQKTQVELDAIRELTSATADLNEIRKSGEENVREEALRTLAVMESNLDFAREMATGFSDAFGTMGEAVGGFIVSLAEYEKQMATIKVQMDEEIAKNPSKRFEIEQKAAEKSAKAQINAYGDMAQSAQKFFKQGSKGYEAMGAAVKVFRTFEMAQSAISAASQIGDMAKNVETFITGVLGMTAAETASVAPTVAAETTKGAVKAKTAVVSQGQIPIAGFALMAAMAALVATMGFNTGGGGSAPAVAEPGTGTVLGDPTAQSESFKNSLDLLVEINSNDLAYSADMLESLRNIESALADASALVAKQILPLIESVTSQSDVSSMLSSSKVTEAGFLVGAQSLLKVISSGQLQGSIGARTESTTGLFGEFKSASTQFAQYGKGIAEAFGKIVQNIYSNVAQSADKIGIPFEEIQKRAEGLKVGLGKVNLAGKSSEEAAKAIEAAFSAMGDKMAMKLLPEFKDFQQSGEGYWQTINRVGAGVAEATGRLELLGMEAIKYTDIQKKSGDISAEITRQTIMAQGDLNEGTREYIRQLTGSASDIIEAYGQILNITNMMRGAGFGTENIDRTMINAAGGLTKFEEALTTFAENFLTPAQRVKSDIASMSAEFGKFGLALPKSREEFTKLILSVDDSTEAGRKLKGQIIGLTPAFDDFISQVDDLRATFEDTKNSILDLQGSIASDIAGLKSPEAEFALISGTVQKAWADLYEYMQGVASGNERNFDYEIQQLNDIRSGVMSRYNSELGLIRQAAQAQATAIKEAANIQIDVLKSGLTAQIDSIKAIADAQITALNDSSEVQIDAINANLEAELELRQKAHEVALESLQKELDSAQKLKSAVEQVRAYAIGMRLGPNAPLSPEQRLQEAQRQYASLLDMAQGGDAEAMSQLTGAADTYLEAARQYYGSGTQYSNLFNAVQNAMESIGSMSVTDPDSIQARIDLLRESQKDELDALRETAQSQIETVKDTTKNQIEAIKQSSEDQIKAAKDALDAQIKAIQDATNKQVEALTDPDQNEAIKKLRLDTIAELERVGIMLKETEYANNRNADDLELIQMSQLSEMRLQTQYLATIAGGNSGNASTPNPGFIPNPVNDDFTGTMMSVASETRASVNVQQAGFTQMIENLQSIDDRLSKMERTQRLNA